jgi:hypothetical protein
MQGFTLCVYCDLFEPGPDGPACAAFPDGIPWEILQGEWDHREPFEGDGDITFVPKPDAPDDAQLDKMYASTKVNMEASRRRSEMHVVE